jgi:GTP:adenosylcobinamide-phosphate guanylyltransferase
MTKLAKLEADVGPLKYIAEFMYGQDADKNLLEEAVRWVIITIIFVFDPLAVLLLIAANFSLKQRYGWDFESFQDRHKKTDSVQKTQPSGLKVGTAIISSRKKQPEVVVKEVESSLDVNKPKDVKELEQKVKQKMEGNSNSSFLDE